MQALGEEFQRDIHILDYEFDEERKDITKTH